MGKGRIAKLAICLLLVVSILTLSFSVFADEEIVVPTDNPYTLVNEIEDWYWRMWIWGALKSFGINISVDQVGEYSEALDAYMENMIEDFLEDVPSISSWNQWILPWVGGFNASGLFEGNSNFVEDINDFANWITGRYDLQDNGNYNLNAIDYVPLYDASDRPLYVNPYIAYLSEGEPNNHLAWYGFNVYGQHQNIDRFYGRIGFDVDKQYRLKSGYYFKIVRDGNYLKYRISTDENMSVVLYSWDQPIINVGFDNTYSVPYYNNNNWYLYNGYNQVFLFKSNSSHATATKYLFADHSSYRVNGVTSTTYNDRIEGFTMSTELFELYFMPASTTGTIVTDDIVTPDDDPDYTPGDSIIIINNEPVYTEIDFPDHISVDNLPAVISPTTITDPDLDGVYGEITPFIRTFSGGMDMMRSIIMQLPEEAIACLYALIGAIIIFGILKIMREH